MWTSSKWKLMICGALLLCVCIKNVDFELGGSADGGAMHSLFTDAKPMALEQLLMSSLKAQPMTSLSSASAQNSTAGNSTAPCDSKCMQARAVVQARMKRLQDDIDRDFQNMIKYGENAVYVPPPRSVKQQVMDGSLFKSKTDDGPPPPIFNDDSLMREIPDATDPRLNAAKVEANEKDIEKSLPTANDLLKTIQDEEQDAHTNVMHDAIVGAQEDTAKSSSTKQASIVSSFPQAFPSVATSAEGAKANPTNSENSEWAKAFSFMNPNGGTEAGSTSGGIKDPLKNDGFLSGIFN